MVDKKKLHYYWTKLRPISYWYFLLAFLISLVITVHALRQNNLHMLKLKSAVTQADKNNGNVEKALQNLRAYVYAHMNTNLASGPNAIKPPIQLKYRYERLLKAEQKRVGSANDNVYTAAQHYCEAKYPSSFSGGPRTPCIADYVSSHGVKTKPIDDTLYKFDFVSPRWSPDLAGWGVVITTILLFLFLLRYGLERWARSVLKTHE